MGLLIIVLFYRSAKEHDDAAFRWMWLTIVLSFGFYIPVVLWANTVPMIGILIQFYQERSFQFGKLGSLRSNLFHKSVL